MRREASDMARQFSPFSRALAGIVGASLPLLMPASVRADVTLFSGLNSFDSWASAAGAYTTIDFTDFPVNTHLTNEYASSGVIFNSDDPDVILGPACSTFTLDCWGLNGVHQTGIDFLAPTYSFSYHHRGKHQVFLFDGATMIYASPGFGGSGGPFFDGLISTQAFDRIEIVPWQDPTASVAIDNIYFSSIPTPPAFAALLIGGLWPSRRRRDRRAT